MALVCVELGGRTKNCVLGVVGCGERGHPNGECELRAVERDVFGGEFRALVGTQKAIDPHRVVPSRKAEVLQSPRSPTHRPFFEIAIHLPLSALHQPEVQPIIGDK